MKPNEELFKQIADEQRERNKEIEANPLLRYSTTQLKKELRRRKKAGEQE